MQRLARGMVRYRLPMFLFCLALTAALYPLSQHIKRDRSVRSFFDPEHPRLLDYTSVQEDFGGDTMCLAVYTDPYLLSAEGMARLEAFTKRLGEVPGVLRAVSLAVLRRPSAPLNPKTLREWFETPGAEEEALGKEILDCGLYADQFIGSDGKTAAVVLLADPVAMANGEFTQTLAELRRLGREHNPPARIVGSPVMINDVYDYLDQDSWVLANVSSLAMMLVILVLFRNLRWMLLPILVVQISLIWTRALMAYLGLDLSLMGSLTTALITVIGIGTAIHVAVRFQEEFLKDQNGQEAMFRTLVEVVPAVFWTCATTAVGFSSLAVSRVAPVRDFGWVMGLSSMFVGAASFLLIPGGVLLGRRGVVPNAVPAEATLIWGLYRLGDWVNRHALLASLLTLLIMGSSLVGIGMIQVETDFTRNFRASSTILDGYHFVEDRLGGAGLVELVFEAPRDPSPEYLDDLRRCQKELLELPGVTKVIALPDVVDFLSPKTSGRSVQPWMQSLQVRALRAMRPPELDQVWNPSRERMRMVLRVKERQSSQDKDRLLAAIHERAARVLGESSVVTGLYVLLVHLIESLLGDQFASFLLSSALILGMTIVAFRSLRLGVVGFVPNLVPITIVMGSMGWLGIKINVATAMMGSISMGLTVDFSIHYLSRFCQEREQGADFFAALAATNRSTGKAMFCANLALMLGFGVLVFSNLLPTMQFGLLISVAMFGGLVGNLVLLPILLRLAYWVR